MTVSGRYYAMDRDQRWERTERALAAIAGRAGTPADDAVAAVQASYERGVTDEFIEPVVLAGAPARRGTTRRSSSTSAPTAPASSPSSCSRRGFDLTTMTRYRDDFDCPVAFAEQDGRGDDGRGARRRTACASCTSAETEKYAHVTYFFNGGREDEWEGETRILVPSPRDVATYDQKPEMSARARWRRRFAAEIGDGYRFAVVNFANPDMVGHTGVIPAVVRAVETVDACLGRVVEAVERRGGVCLVTADHGNAEELLEPDGTSPHTAHTTNPVPLVVTLDGAELRGRRRRSPTSCRPASSCSESRRRRRK